MGFEIIASSEVAPVAFDMTDGSCWLLWAFDQDTRESGLRDYELPKRTLSSSVLDRLKGGSELNVGF